MPAPVRTSASVRPAPSVHPVAIARFRAGREIEESDLVAREAPLQIEIGGRVLAVVMRTPGDDLDLVRGLLFTEGIVAEARDVAAIGHCRRAPAGAPEDARENVVRVTLRPGLAFSPARFRRNLLASAACGVCGRATIDSLARRSPRVESDLVVAPELLLGLPRALRSAQPGFDATGGLHAAALFAVRDGAAKLLALREDVGRHNAVDKVIGAALRDGLLPLSRCILQVSGRAGYDIVQKARVAGIPVVAAVSAPSSLAVELADAGGQTLVAFVRDDRFNVYSGRSRLARSATTAAPREAAPASRENGAPPPPTGRRRRSGSRGRRAGA
jgi:FdhD protein